MRGSRSCPPEEGWERIDLVQHVEHESLQLHTRKFGPVKLRASGLATLARHPRSLFDNCQFRDVRAYKSMVHRTVFRNCTFRNVHADFAHTYTALFLECRLEGRISGINFGFQPLEPHLDKGEAPTFRAENERLLSSARYCLDVRDALLEDAGFLGEDFARRIVFNPGQCVIFQADELAARIKKVLPRVVRTPLSRAFVAVVREGERLALGTLQPNDNTARLAEIRGLARSEGIEVIEHPLVG